MGWPRWFHLIDKGMWMVVVGSAAIFALAVAIWFGPRSTPEAPPTTRCEPYKTTVETSGDVYTVLVPC